MNLNKVLTNRFDVKPRYPLPAIPLSVHWPDTGYRGCVYIDSDQFEDDPIMVAVWDFYSGSLEYTYIGSV